MANAKPVSGSDEKPEIADPRGDVSHVPAPKVDPRAAKMGEVTETGYRRGVPTPLYKADTGEGDPRHQGTIRVDW